VLKMISIHTLIVHRNQCTFPCFTKSDCSYFVISRVCQYWVFHSKPQTLFHTHKEHVFVRKLYSRSIRVCVSENCFCAFDRDGQYIVYMFHQECLCFEKCKLSLGVHNLVSCQDSLLFWTIINDTIYSITRNQETPCTM
jgi:hypothetical protein